MSTYLYQITITEITTKQLQTEKVIIVATSFNITQNDVSESLLAVTETWFDNYRALMGTVEKDALAGLPKKVALVSALSFVKDTSSLAKDHFPKEAVRAFFGSSKFAVSLFVVDVASQAYEAHWKNLEARANSQKGAMYTTIFVDYLQKLCLFPAGRAHVIACDYCLFYEIRCLVLVLKPLFGGKNSSFKKQRNTW